MSEQAPALEPLDVLFEAPRLPPNELPEELGRLYGGSLGFRRPALVANFVSTLDGVVAIPSLAHSSRLISGESAADRFVMSLLRAFADAVVIGSGTLHGSPTGLWRPDGPYPPVGPALGELRRKLELPPLPELAVLTRSGSVDVDHPALGRPSLIVTTDAGEAALRGRVPSTCALVSLGDAVDPGPVMALLRERGHSLVLTEGGPTVFGAFLVAGLVDELFLTLSPLLAGRESGDGRLQLVEDSAWPPGDGPEARLLSARRHGSHLFLRYGLA